MAIRIDLEFPYPLGKETRTDLLLAVGDLAKAERVYFGRTGFNAVIMGEAMSTRRVLAKLREYGLEVERITSSLPEDEADRSDDTGPTDGTGTDERFKAIGRGG